MIPGTPADGPGSFDEPEHFAPFGIAQTASTVRERAVDGGLGDVDSFAGLEGQLNHEYLSIRSVIVLWATFGAAFLLGATLAVVLLLAF